MVGTVGTVVPVPVGDSGDGGYGGPCPRGDGGDSGYGAPQPSEGQWGRCVQLGWWSPSQWGWWGRWGLMSNANVSVRSAQLFLHGAPALRGSTAAAGLPGCGARGQGSSINHQRRTGGGLGDPQVYPSERLTPPPPSSRAISSPLLRRTCSGSTNRTASETNAAGFAHGGGTIMDMSHPEGERRVLLLPEASSNHSGSLEQLCG